jgi:hypothetical protein
MNSLLEYVKHYLQDGRSRKLIDIVTAVHAMGWQSSPSSRYIHIYHELREHPELFERVTWGHYRLKKNRPARVTSLSPDERRDLIEDILRKHPKQTPTQVWRGLQALGITITYKATAHLLKSDMFTKDEFSRYSVEK